MSDLDSERISFNKYPSITIKINTYLYKIKWTSPKDCNMEDYGVSTF